MRVKKIDDNLYQLVDVNNMPIADFVSRLDAEFALRCFRNKEKIISLLNGERIWDKNEV